MQPGQERSIFQKPERKVELGLLQNMERNMGEEYFGSRWLTQENTLFFFLRYKCVEFSVFYNMVLGNNTNIVVGNTISA